MSFTKYDGTQWKGWNITWTGKEWEAYDYPTGEYLTAATHAELIRKITLLPLDKFIVQIKTARTLRRNHA